jgi:hypothetical protein
MMTTRALIAATLLATAGLAVAAEQDTRVFELRTYHAAPGKLENLQARFRDHTIDLFQKHGMTNIGYWTPIENPDNLLIYMLAFPSQEARDKAWKAFFADPQWQRAKKESEVDGRLVAKVESVLLSPTDYSPQVEPSVAAPRVFELRTYTATPGNLGHLNARFREHTVELFKKHGITNFGYWCPLEGQPGAGETLIYILAHESVDAARASFDAFRQDPAWIAARKASEEKAGGPLTVKGGVKSLFLQATDYSPTR